MFYHLWLKFATTFYPNMADEGRTSRRAKKQIDYAQFGVDEDDDFQEMTPPLKKAKLTKEKKQNSKKDIKEPKISKKNGRKSVDDKVYERELEMVLELSKADMHPVPVESPSKGDSSSKGESTDEMEMPKLEPITDNIPRKTSLLKSTKLQILNSDEEGADTIEVLQEDVQDTPPGRGRKKRRAVVKAMKKLTDSDDGDDERQAAMDESTDEDFKPLDTTPFINDNASKPLTDDDDDDDDDVTLDENSSDGENEPSSKRAKRGRGRGRGGRSGPKIKARLSATVQLVDKSKNKAMVHRAPPSSRPTIHSTPPARTPSGDLKIRTPIWLAPAFVSGKIVAPSPKKTFLCLTLPTR